MKLKYHDQIRQVIDVDYKVETDRGFRQESTEYERVIVIRFRKGNDKTVVLGKIRRIGGKTVGSHSLPGIGGENDLAGEPLTLGGQDADIDQPAPAGVTGRKGHLKVITA